MPLAAASRAWAGARLRALPVRPRTLRPPPPSCSRTGRSAHAGCRVAGSEQERCQRTQGDELRRGSPPASRPAR
eukprot:gene15741-biopygen3705